MSIDLYIARVIHVCRVPAIVPYAVLYLLAAVSRTCNCGRRIGPEREIPYKNTCDSSSKLPSMLSHYLSQFLANNPFKRLLRPLWTAHHFFIGALLCVLREYHKDYSPSALAKISGVDVDDLIYIHIAISFCVNTDTAIALAWMIKESEFRSLSDVECPVVVSYRKRLAERKENRDNRRSSLRWVFSIRRSRPKSSSSDISLESQRSTKLRISFSKLLWLS